MTDHPRCVHGGKRHIGGPFDLRVMEGGFEIVTQPTDAELWTLALKIMEYLAERAKP